MSLGYIHPLWGTTPAENPSDWKERVASELAARSEPERAALWERQQAEFAAALAEQGFSGWCPELALARHSAGQTVPWQPAEWLAIHTQPTCTQVDVPVAVAIWERLLDEQDVRGKLATLAATGIDSYNEAASVLAVISEPCPEKGFARRNWQSALERARDLLAETDQKQATEQAVKSASASAGISAFAAAFARAKRA